MRATRPPPKPTPSLTTPDYGPGQMSESDWSPYEIQFTTGKTAVIQALSYVLVVSKRKYFGLYPRCSRRAAQPRDIALGAHRQRAVAAPSC